MIYLLNIDEVSQEIFIEKLLKDDRNLFKVIVRGDKTVLDLLEELDNVDLLHDKKMVVVKGLDLNEEGFLNYLENPNPKRVLLILDEIDKRTKVGKKLSQVAQIISKNYSFYETINYYLEGFDMKKDAIFLLEEYTLKDKTKALQELEKLKLLKIEEQEININDIKNVVIKTRDYNVFNLFDALGSDNIKVEEIYNSIIKDKNEEAQILAMLFNNFYVMYLAKCTDDYKKVYEKAEMHEYRVKKIIEKSFKFTQFEVIRFLKDLVMIDILKKQGKDTVGLFKKALLDIKR